MSDIIIDRQAAIDEPLLPSLEQLTHWVGCVFSRHPDDDRLELTIRFVDEEESQALNRDYREKDKPTNVLSFPFENPPGITLPLLGDLIICHAVVADHIEEQEAEEMEQLERELLATLNIPDPYHV